MKLFLLSVVIASLLIILLLPTLIYLKSENFQEVRDLIFYVVEITKFKVNVSFIAAENETLPLGLEFHENVLSFGEVPINSPIERVRKSIFLSNRDHREAIVKVFCEGKVCNFLNFSQQIFKLKPYENVSLEISLENKGILGNFEGFVYINVIKRKIL